MKLLFLVAMLPLALADKCYGHGECIFDFKQSPAFKDFTRDLETANNTEAIKVYTKMMDGFIRLHETKDSYGLIPEDMTDSYNEKVSESVRLHVHASYVAARDRLLTILEMKKEAAHKTSRDQQEAESIQLRKSVGQQDYATNVESFREKVNKIRDEAEEKKDLAQQEFNESDQNVVRLYRSYRSKTSVIDQRKVKEARDFWREVQKRIATLEDEELESEFNRVPSEGRELEMQKFKAELEARKETRRKNAIIPDDPKGRITNKQMIVLRELKRRMDKLKEPTKDQIKVLDNIELDEF
ncbi:hypothetical protein DSO57_1023495 [Entomophthora muscae]|uniref:Uncharacterized protein n=1 Tax=Entomophthora muscae TaxID=34485 RepID=A0ACC2U0Z5_9FUNG|nr:hypothetical protein DSO57_1023495 [Entomophthora muscae]